MTHYYYRPRSIVLSSLLMGACGSGMRTTTCISEGTRTQCTTQNDDANIRALADVLDHSAKTMDSMTALIAEKSREDAQQYELQLRLQEARRSQPILVPPER